jgi:hypothetical protein
MAKPTKRSERLVRPISAWLVTSGRANQECLVLDISPRGAKVVVQAGSAIPDRFELAFFQSIDKRRMCEVIWRRGKVLGVKFAS